MNDLKKYGIVVLGVSADSVFHIKNFTMERNLTLTCCLTKKGGHKKYGANGPLTTRRITYIIDRNQKIAYVFDKVHPQGHSKEVLKRSKSLV